MRTPFPPGDTAWRDAGGGLTAPRTPWREFRFMHRQVSLAVLGHLPLQHVLGRWAAIARRLREGRRRRAIQDSYLSRRLWGLSPAARRPSPLLVGRGLVPRRSQTVAAPCRAGA